MNPLIKSLDPAKIEEIGLVLTSQGIPFHVSEEPDGFAIHVPSAYARKALIHIEEYSHEYFAAESPDADTYRFSHGIPIGLIVLLISIHFWRMNLPPDIDVIGAFSNTTSTVEYGQLYRLTTSLFLHVDIRHLIGNCAALWLFGSSVCGRLGDGAGTFLMLYCGILGNLFSVIIRDGFIRSMGASTAVFAGLGILVGMRIYGRQDRRETVHPMLVLAAGLALLGFLGTGVQSDLFAHLGGFIFGLFSGLMHRFIVPRKSSTLIQIFFGIISVFTVIASWLRLIRF